MYIAGGIFKYTDQEYRIVIRIQLRFDIFKITHVYAHVFRILMSVCIDKAALF